ncbi:MAG: DUF5678 domain-containing protein [Candidatus Pacearchaeota archaeon]|nr:DUF5678 domain-containing protein [Candidatus Pacearchaeota archaeon]
MELTQNYSFFTNAELSPFIGEWVAICNQEIVSHGKLLKEVLKKAKQKCPQIKPLIVKVPEKETMIF